MWSSSGAMAEPAAIAGPAAINISVEPRRAVLRACRYISFYLPFRVKLGKVRLSPSLAATLQPRHPREAGLTRGSAHHDRQLRVEPRMNVITGMPSSVLTFLESPSRLSGRSVLFRKKGTEQW